MSSIPGNTSTNATIIKGQTIKNALTSAGDADWFKAAFSAGLDYGFRLSGDGSGNTLPDPDLYLYDANGNYLEGETNYSSSSMTISFSALAGGTYFVGVKDNGDDFGNYILTWLGNDTIRRDVNTTSTLAQGQTIKSAVDVAGDSDWFKISLKAGLDYGFAVSGDGSGSSLPDTDLFLRDANGNWLAGETNYSSSSYSIAYAASQSGVYFLDVKDNGNDVGNYNLSWVGADTILRNTSTTAVLGTGKSIASAVDVRGDSDWFKVTLKAGISYAFTVTGSGAGGLPDGDIFVRDANGTYLAGETNYSSATGLVTFTPSAGGTYFIEVKDNASDIGKYIVANPSLDTVFNNTKTTSSLLVGRSLGGKIDVQADSDWYGFSVKAGVTYKFTASGTGSDAASGLKLVLRDANGDVISSDSDTSAVIEFTASNTGKVFLDIAGYSSSVKGSFKISAVSNDALLKGTSAADSIMGGDNNTTIYGYAGNDKLSGGGGNDVLVGGTGADGLSGGTGMDIASYKDATSGVVASLANPSLNSGEAKGDTYYSIEGLGGSAHADILVGDNGANLLSGAAGNDKLYGAGGADRLYGGSGADIFIFKSYKDSILTAQDMVYDFSQSQGDKIDLSSIDARTTTAGDQAFTFIGEKAFSNKAGELRYINQNGDTYLYGDINGDGKSDLAVRFDNNIEFTKGDFFL